MLELLAPAGSMDALRAAVQNGADAVYLGCGAFNARQGAKNFTIPMLTEAEQNDAVKGILVIMNTMGGDVEAGLAIAELIRGMSKPSVSLVLGGGHSIGVPLAVSADYSFIAATASMTIHPIRLTGMVVGVQQSFDYMIRMQERIVGFITSHCQCPADRVRRLMLNTDEIATDLGTVLDGRAAVNEGLIDSLGSIKDALEYLHGRMEN